MDITLQYCVSASSGLFIKVKQINNHDTDVLLVVIMVSFLTVPSKLDRIAWHEIHIWKLIITLTLKLSKWNICNIMQIGQPQP